MQNPQIYIGEIPATLDQRRALRATVLDLRQRLRFPRDTAPTLALLNAVIPGAGAVDVLVLRPNALIVGALRFYDGPISVADGYWLDQHGAPLREEDGRTPLASISARRDLLRAMIAETLEPLSPELRVTERMIAALIATPALHPDSRVALEIEDHRALRKVLGLDELAGLAAMASAGVRMPETSLAAMVELLGGRLWHDGNRLLFELAPPRYCLRMIVDGQPRRMALPLLEGENTIGRRRIARPQEHRLTIAGDDLVSTDHAMIYCAENGGILLRDISKNGTWVAMPGAVETFLRDAELPITPGVHLRMGDTRMRLEEIRPESVALPTTRGNATLES